MDAQYTPSPPTHTHQPLSFSLHAHLLIDLQGGTAPCVGVQSVVHASACAFAFQLGSGIGHSEPGSACWPRDRRAVGPPNQGSTWTYGLQLTPWRTHRHSQITSELVDSFSLRYRMILLGATSSRRRTYGVSRSKFAVCVWCVGGGWWVACLGWDISNQTTVFERGLTDAQPLVL